jgi:hypothetical protein
MRTLILASAVIGSVVVLLALRAPTPAPVSEQGTPPAEVVNEPGLMEKLFNIPPAPLTDCGSVRGWLVEHPRAFHAVLARPHYSVEIQYRPPLCTACFELPNARLDEPGFKQRSEELAGGDSYLLRIFPGPGPETPPVASMAWQHRIVQVVGVDTLPCAFVHVETLPPGVKHQNLLLGFDTGSLQEDRSVIIKDSDGTLGGDLVLTLPKGGTRALAQALHPTES